MATYQLTLDMPRTIFRAYDIRGISPTELNENIAYTIARAISVLLHDAQQTSVILGCDGRLTSPALFLAVQQGFIDSGLHVISIGAVPTPVMYFATKTLATNSGVIITGSHNPAEYNGLKIVIAGKTLAENAIQSVYECIIAQKFRDGQGSVERYRGLIAEYAEAICKRVQLKRRLKVVVDCGNGIAGIIAEPILKKLGVDVIPLFTEVDGKFPNHHPDPTDAKTLTVLRETVMREGADCGLAYDGDGDRLGVVTNIGEVIPADCVLALFADHLLQRYPGAKIIYDVKCTGALSEVIKNRGGEGIMWKTGHSLIKAKMLEENALLAGEMSGHIFFSENWYGFDDGFYAGVRFLEILAETRDTADDLFAALPLRFNTPELKIQTNDTEKFAIMARCQKELTIPGASINTIDGVRAEFVDGWALIRASNTTPCLILRFEAENQTALQRIQDEFLTAIQKLYPNLQLPW